MLNVLRISQLKDVVPKTNVLPETCDDDNKKCG